MENPLDKLKTEIRDKPTTLDIVSSLLDKENIVMKTEITNPYALDTLNVFGIHLKEHGFEDANEIIELWIQLLLEYMVSNKRMSRQEITEILKGYFALEQQKSDVKLTSNLAKINQQSSF